MKCLVLGLMIANLMCSLSFAKNRLLVSNFQTNSEFVSNEDLLMLTERVIVIISEMKTYDLITKENILTLLPPDQNLEECIDKCEIETGRLVGANKVISGWVVKSKGLYQLTVKLHDTRTGVLEVAKLISATNFKGVLSELQIRRFSLLQTDKEAKRDLENRLALIKSSILEKEERKRKILQKEANERLRLEEKKRKRVKLMLKKKKEKERKRIKRMIKRHKGGVESKQSWAITSPYPKQTWVITNFHGLGDGYRKFLFHPGLVPFLTLSGGGLKKRKFVMTDEGFIAGPDRTIDIDHVKITENGIGYDEEGRTLEPILIKPRYYSRGHISKRKIIYVNKRLLDDDLKKYRASKHNNTTSLVITFNSLYSIVVAIYKIESELHDDQNPYLFGSLLTTNILIYGLCALWCPRPKYHYPKYSDEYSDENNQYINWSDDYAARWIDPMAPYQRKLFTF